MSTTYVKTEKSNLFDCAQDQNQFTVKHNTIKMPQDYIQKK